MEGVMKEVAQRHIHNLRVLAAPASDRFPVDAGTFDKAVFVLTFHDLPTAKSSGLQPPLANSTFLLRALIASSSFFVNIALVRRAANGKLRNGWIQRSSARVHCSE